jgi:predicted negative regulator of RcsB-dependent stress response
MNCSHRIIADFSDRTAARTMATQLDLQEQEQLDALKAFWNQYGNLITWVLILVLGAFAAWNGWQYWQRDQAFKAGAMFDELERAAQAGDADKAGRVFADLKERFPRTAYASRADLLAAKRSSTRVRPMRPRPA